jgi:positive regulator of sigma E activity
MITEAKVISVSADGRFALVENDRKSACEGCHMSTKDGGCSVCSLTGADRRITTKAYNKIGARVGDTVAISTGTGRVLGYAWLVFLMPILFALLGWWIGSGVFSDQMLAGIFAAAGIVLCFGLVWLYSKLVVEKRCDAEIVSVISRGDAGGKDDMDKNS